MLHQMTRSVFVRCIFYCLAAAAVLLFYEYGRSLWQPVLGWARGDRTVADRLQELQAKMDTRYSDIDALTDGGEIVLVVLKEERILELWKRLEGSWHWVKSFPLTGFSGRLGPKLKEGDGQIPEGIYRIEYLNPNSAFHLSMKINYPNAFDREMGQIDGRENLGFDIFIHGKSVTIGCIPVGDAAIEELFYIVARNGAANTRVILSPYDMRKGRRDLDIPGVNWEKRLYETIDAELKTFVPENAL